MCVRSTERIIGEGLHRSLAVGVMEVVVKVQYLRGTVTQPRQCLSRRIDNTDDMRREVNAWEVARNASGAKVNWRFRTEDARIILKKLYPSIE